MRGIENDVRAHGCVGAIIGFALVLGFAIGAALCTSEARGSDAGCIAKRHADTVQRDATTVMEVSFDTVAVERNSLRLFEVSDATQISWRPLEKRELLVAVFNAKFALPGEPFRRIVRAKPLRHVASGAANAVRRVGSNYSCR